VKQNFSPSYLQDRIAFDERHIGTIAHRPWRRRLDCGIWIPQFTECSKLWLDSKLSAL